MKKCLLAALLLLGVITTQAQTPAFPIGLNPPGMKWRQIETDRVQVIFPQGYDSLGQRVANTIHYLWDHNNPSVGEKQKKVSIFLQNQPVTSNGFVSYTPFRSEFYLNPPQQPLLAVSNWLDPLTIHEYRHVKQLSNARRGITKLAKNVLGGAWWRAMSGIAMPRWYFEGDAVGEETSLTLGGRGRSPAFDMEYRALYMAGRKYNYEKASAFSLKDYVPDHYRQGYYMTTYARKHFGRDLWANVQKDAVRFKGILYPLSRSLKKRTGMRSPQLFRAAMGELDSLWHVKYGNLEISPADTLSPSPRKTFTWYRFPQFGTKGQVIAERSSFKKIRAFCVIDSTGKERVITRRGIYSRGQANLSVRGEKMAWAEFGYDPRWGYRVYSNLYTYDMASGKKKQLSRKARYFSPDLSPDGTKILAIKTDIQTHQSLVVLDAQTGETLKTYPNPNNKRLINPRWNSDGKSWVVVCQDNKSVWIEQFDPETLESRQLLAPGPYPITNPYPHGSYVYFSGAHTGTNNIFAVDVRDQQVYQVTEAAYGAFEPAVDETGTKLLYADYNYLGYQVRSMDLKPENWKPYDVKTPSKLDYYEVLVEQEGGNILDKIPNEEFPVSPFRKKRGLFYPHSIFPSIFPPIYSAGLLFDNKFSTLSGIIGATYDENEERFSYNASVSYAEWYPVLRFNYLRGNRSRSQGIAISQEDTIQAGGITSEWLEDDFSVGLSVPLNLSRGTFRHSLEFIADYHWVNVQQFNGTRFEPVAITPVLQNDWVQFIEGRIRLRSFQQVALQNVATRWGILGDLRYRRTVNPSSLRGEYFSASTFFFVPGLASNHSLSINAAYQKELYTNAYLFRQTFFYPRGYDSFGNDQVGKLTFTYGLPLFYPDLPLFSLAFFQRVRTNLFFDWGFARQSSLPNALNNREEFIASQSARAQVQDDQFRSVGAELIFDFRALRLLDVSLGMRYSYLLDPETDFFRYTDRHQLSFIILNISN